MRLRSFFVGSGVDCEVALLLRRTRWKPWLRPGVHRLLGFSLPHVRTD